MIRVYIYGYRINLMHMVPHAAVAVACSLEDISEYMYAGLDCKQKGEGEEEGEEDEPNIKYDMMNDESWTEHQVEANM